MNQSKQDKELVEAFHLQDIHAIQELFKLHYRSLVYFCTHLINDRQEAEDIVANTFVKLLDRRENFDNLRDIKAFLYVTTRNSCLDHLRSVQRHEHSHREIFYLNGGQDNSADTDMMKAQVLHEIYTEMEQLPTQCKNIFKLMFIKGLNTRQIAEQMGISAQTVLNQKTKALQLIRGDLVRKNLLPRNGGFLHISLGIFCLEMLN